MGRGTFAFLAWMAVVALATCYALLGVAFPHRLPDIARLMTAVLLVNLVVGALIVLWRARSGEDPSDEDGGDDGGRGGGGGGTEPWPWRWPTDDGGSALRVPDYVPEEWLPKQPVER